MRLNPSYSQMIDDQIRAWVKIPTLQPNETNALMYLTEAELLKLAGRVTEALKRIERVKADRLFKPGDVVKHSSNGKRGLVIETPPGIPDTSAVPVHFFGAPSYTWCLPANLRRD